MPIKNFKAVVPHTDINVYKDRILSELFLCGAVQEKIKGICYRNFVKKDTYIQEDILQETFFHLCKTKAEQLIEMYESDSSRLLGLSVRIAILKGVMRNKNNPEYPKHSVLTNILFASNLNRSESLSVTDDIEESLDSFNYVLIDPSSLPDEAKEIMTLVYPELTEDENDFLDVYISKKKRNRSKTEIAKFAELSEKIRTIILNLNL